MTARVALSQNVLENVTQGICVYDADNQVVLFNRRFLELFNLSADVVRQGISYRQLLEHSASRDNFAPELVEDHYRTRLALLASGKPCSVEQEQPNGIVTTLDVRPLPDGGWLTVCEDVTERRRSEDALKQKNLLLDAALENMAHGLCVYDKDMRLLVCNSNYLNIYGLAADEAKPGTHLSDLVRTVKQHGVYSADFAIDQLLDDLSARLSGHKDLAVQRRMPDGRRLAVRYSPLSDGSFVCTYEDVTERERAHDTLIEQYRRFDAALNNMSHGLCMLDSNLRVIVCNRRYIDMYGMSPEIVKPGITMREIVEHSWALGNYPATTAQQLYDDYVQRLNEGARTHYRHLSDGRIFKLSHHPMEHGGWVIIYEDVTERHKAQERVAHMAKHDALTDLANRVLFREKMADGLKQVAQDGAMAVLCLDLDNFKTVNDRLGHAIGDGHLRWVAERILERVGENDTVARLGGDEFAVLQRGPQPQSAETLASRLVEVIGRPPPLENQTIHTGVSIGIAIAPDHGLDPDELMKRADLALYQAKAKGRGVYQLFRAEMETQVRSRQTLEAELCKALEAGEFHLAFQPQIRLGNNELTGFEALLRWNCTGRGAVSPAEFIPVAEETGLIVPLGEWVLRSACATAAKWPDFVRVAVNLSPVQFRARGLVAMVTSALASAGLAPQRLELEVTETALLEDDAATVAILRQLRSLGVRISLDDFGVGYSALGYLRKFPFDMIKIDRSFVQTLGESHESGAIVRTIAALGANLGVETTAEGVETAQQLELVREAGCTAVQGFYFGRPRPAADIGHVIEQLNPINRVA